MKKILFLDVDGVMNSEETLRHYNRYPTGIDPYLALLVNRIIEATGCEVVLSSAWRGSEESHAIIEEAIGHKLLGITGRCCSGIRGVEIHNWLTKNLTEPRFSSDGYKKNEHRVAILDDESDMLIWQKDHFFQTSFKTGITEDIAAKVIAHLNEGEKPGPMDRCGWCGMMHAEHDVSRPEGSPVPRVPCLGLVSGFLKKT